MRFIIAIIATLFLISCTPSIPMTCGNGICEEFENCEADCDIVCEETCEEPIPEPEDYEFTQTHSCQWSGGTNEYEAEGKVTNFKVVQFYKNHTRGGNSHEGWNSKSTITECKSADECWNSTALTYQEITKRIDHDLNQNATMIPAHSFKGDCFFTFNRTGFCMYEDEYYYYSSPGGYCGDVTRWQRDSEIRALSDYEWERHQLGLKY